MNTNVSFRYGSIPSRNNSSLPRFSSVIPFLFVKVDPPTLTHPINALLIFEAITTTIIIFNLRYFYYYLNILFLN